MLAVALCLTAPGPSRAADIVSPGATVRLLEGGMYGAGRARLGLEIDLRPGWKTYWRSPGDGGFPPEIDTSASLNVAEVGVGWPAPHRQAFMGFETIGYDGSVVLPLDVRLADPGASARLDVRGAVYVCSDICTRVEIAFAADIDPGSVGRDADAARIEAFRALVPRTAEQEGVTLDRAEIVQASGGPELRVVATAQTPFGEPDLLVEAEAPLAFGAPRLRFATERRRVELTAPLAPPLPEGLDVTSAMLRLTLLDGSRAVEAHVRATAGQPPGVAGEGWKADDRGNVARLASILATALLGGLILNLMPCVLPVLSLKLLSAARHGGGTPRSVRAGFLASAAGILFSFLVLATAMVGLKIAGAGIGWGIQFQQPLFLILLVILLTLFSANLLGLFEIPLPRLLADKLGGGGRKEGSLAGHFATGAFATLLATPCSAPFLGTAVGFALSRGATEIYLVFAALGLGLALPYLLVATLPSLATRLPRPGRWMLTLRRLLAVPLVLTAVWLLSILSVQTGVAAAAIVALLMIALAAILVGIDEGGPGRSTTAALAALSLLAAALLAPLTATVLPDAADAPARAVAGVNWSRFQETEIAGRVEAGGVVFVGVTADWCLTCKVNERVALADVEVARRLNGADVSPMLADWTRPDPVISAYLRRFDRYGIPFNVVYGPAARDGIVLPELLTKERVLQALDEALGRAP
ncbi:protein-disulfide reductase DsbD [Roseomonas sp. KE2513]|uniref:protein-disulfide reductase DsbD family protein n=1 Tax=Roseomonas sp. KE2513 TaxID=2479202 RepID=UPI001E3A7A29|nr:protein-disulfide reductase DsbD domain-containing protein [Roseomonas sp. KE2513]